MRKRACTEATAYAGPVLGALLTALIALAAVDAAAQSAGGEAIARNCFTCHGTNGKGNGPIPPLAGLQAEQIAAAMADFRSGRRSSTIMTRIAKGYSDEQTKLLAEYVASLK